MKKSINVFVISAVVIGLVVGVTAAWLQHVTLRPPIPDDETNCEVHGTRLEWGRTKINDWIDVLYDDDYLAARKHFPYARRDSIMRMATGTTDKKWRYTLTSFCPECTKAEKEWERASPDEREKITRQPVRYVRTPEFLVQVSRSTNGLSCRVADQAVSTAMLERIMGRVQQETDGCHVVFAVESPLAPTDAEPLVEMARRHGVTNVVSRMK